jgi:raffinose/stachyose/melibiose transport system permease protein
MFYGCINTVPTELDEAAAIDGAGPMRTFWSIIFPLLKPCTTTVAIFIGLSMWNDFMTPLIIGQFKTITVGIYTAIGPYSSDWGTVFAFVLVGSIPIIVAYLIAQKQFISGLTAGALKG